jgi:hypothetical protein
VISAQPLVCQPADGTQNIFPGIKRADEYEVLIRHWKAMAHHTNENGWW